MRKQFPPGRRLKKEKKTYVLWETKYTCALYYILYSIIASKRH